MNIEELLEQYRDNDYYNLSKIENITKLCEEIERLKQGYCELKEKCNKGECDCTHEEYNGMCEENIKMDLEIERLNKLKERYQLEKEVFKDRIDKAIEYMNYTFNISSVKEMYEIMNELEKILQGSDKE